MIRFKQSILFLFMSLSAVVHAQTDNQSNLVTFETEEEFVTHLISETADLYKTPNTIDVEWTGVFYSKQFTINLGFEDVDVRVSAPLTVLNQKYNGTLLTLEYRF